MCFFCFLLLFFVLFSFLNTIVLAKRYHYILSSISFISFRLRKKKQIDSCNGLHLFFDYLNIIYSLSGVFVRPKNTEVGCKLKLLLCLLSRNGSSQNNIILSADEHTTSKFWFFAMKIKRTSFSQREGARWFDSNLNNSWKTNLFLCRRPVAARRPSYRCPLMRSRNDLAPPGSCVSPERIRVRSVYPCRTAESETLV